MVAKENGCYGELENVCSGKWLLSKMVAKKISKENDRKGRRYITLNTEDICQGSLLHGKRIANIILGRMNAKGNGC